MEGKDLQKSEGSSLMVEHLESRAHGVSCRVRIGIGGFGIRSRGFAPRGVLNKLICRQHVVSEPTLWIFVVETCAAAAARPARRMSHNVAEWDGTGQNGAERALQNMTEHDRT